MRKLEIKICKFLDNKISVGCWEEIMEILYTTKKVE
jgi:hypothetical protein